MILVVGAAGFIGAAIVRLAAERPEGDGDVHALVRRPAPELEQFAKVHVGDARALRLGLDADTAAELSAQVRHLVVSVGSVDFATTPSEVRAQHLAPVRGALAFARTCPNLEHVVYLSSLAAIGECGEPMGAADVPSAFTPRNFYEWGKYEAERMVRQADVPVRLVRPAQVMNSFDDADRTRTPLVLFEVLPLLAAGWPLVTGPDTPYWCAPVDFVADVALALCDPAAPEAAWAIDPAAPSLDELLDHLALAHGLASPRLRSRRLAALVAGVVDPRWLGSQAGREVLAYCHARYDLDLSCVRGLIEQGRVRPPADRSYVARTVEHELARLKELR